MTFAGQRNKLPEAFRVGDTYYYADIAENGYEHVPYEASTIHNWGFFPLYPLVLRAAATITGEFYLTGALLSTFFFFLSLIVLYRVVFLFGGNEDTAQKAVFYLSIYPVSYFFSLAYAESLFLLLILTCVVLAKRERWWLAALIGALASATRVTGILIVPLLLLMYLQTYHWKIRLNALSVLLVPTGLVAFMFYIGRITGNALAVIQSQSASGRDVSGVFFFKPLLEFVLHPGGFWGWSFAPFCFGIAMLALWSAADLFLKRSWALAVFTILSLVMPLSTGTMTSIPRYMMVVFPILISLANVAQRPSLDHVIRMVFTAFLTLMALACALHYTFAVT